MPPNNTVANSSLASKSPGHDIKMNALLSTSSGPSRLYRRSDLAESSNSSINTSGLNGLQIPEDTPHFHYEKERLKSFEGWPVSFISPSSMAAAGFYYLKRDDVVRCAFCGVEVGCWVEGDSPMLDHERWSSSCRFVRKLPVGNIPLSTSNSNNNASMDVSKENGTGYDTCGRIEFRPENRVSACEKDKPLPALEKLGIHKSRAPSFPNYASLEARLRSFEMWPIALKLKPVTLSEAGFFYTGKGDQTICFHCGGGLKDWEESDEPWVEHARWFSKCNFVLLVKGKSFVDEVCGRKMKGKSKSEENVNTSTQTMKEEKNKQESETKKEVDSNESSKSEPPSSSVCKICYTEEVGVVFLPCGHLVACVKCALSLTTCAVCRQAVTATVRVFLS